MGFWNGAQIGMTVKPEDKELAEQFLAIVCAQSDDASFW